MAEITVPVGWIGLFGDIGVDCGPCAECVKLNTNNLLCPVIGFAPTISSSKPESCLASNPDFSAAEIWADHPPNDSFCSKNPKTTKGFHRRGVISSNAQPSEGGNAKVSSACGVSD